MESCKVPDPTMYDNCFRGSVRAGKAVLLHTGSESCYTVIRLRLLRKVRIRVREWFNHGVRDGWKHIGDLSCCLYEPLHRSYKGRPSPRPRPRFYRGMAIFPRPRPRSGGQFLGSPRPRSKIDSKFLGLGEI